MAVHRFNELWRGFFFVFRGSSGGYLAEAGIPLVEVVHNQPIVRIRSGRCSVIIPHAARETGVLLFTHAARSTTSRYHSAAGHLSPTRQSLSQVSPEKHPTHKPAQRPETRNIFRSEMRQQCCCRFCQNGTAAPVFLFLEAADQRRHDGRGVRKRVG